MFGAFAFAQMYLAGIEAIIRRAAAGVGGSGFAPNWSEIMLANLEESERRRRENERELEEATDLLMLGLL